jgi:hypothetical protein
MYIALFAGFIFNVVMHIPLMVLFHKIGIPIYYGNLAATIIGYIITIFICLKDLRNAFAINYSRTIKRTIVILFATAIMIIVVKLLGIVIPVGNHSRLMSLIIVGFYAIVGMTVYFGITYKTKTFDRIIGKDIISVLLRKKDK